MSSAENFDHCMEYPPAADAEHKLSSDEESIEVINEADDQSQDGPSASDSTIDELIENIHTRLCQSGVKTISTHLTDSATSATLNNSWDFGENVVSSEESANSVETEPAASVGLKSFFSQDGAEKIKRKKLTTKRVDQLTVSARVKYGGIEICLHNEGRLLTADDNFTAKVTLEAPHTLDYAGDFAEAKAILLEQLRIEKVFANFQHARRAELRMEFVQKIESDARELDNCRGKYMINYYQLSNIIDRLGQSDNIHFRSVCGEIVKSSSISQDWKELAKELYDIELETLMREEIYSNFGYIVEDDSLTHSNNFKIIRQNASERHKKHLITSLKEGPSYLQDDIMKVSPERLFLINSNDMKLFLHLTTYLRNDIFQKPVKDIFYRWFNKINSLQILEDSRIIQSTNPVFYDLCEYLQEMVTTIGHTEDVDMTKLFTSDKNGWQPIGKIPWKYDTIISRVLERGYLFLFEMLKHFEPCADRFPFQHAVKALDKPEYKLTWLEVLNQLKHDPTSANPFDISDTYHVWYCLLDDILANILPNETSECVIQAYIRLILSPNMVNKLRVRLIILLVEISPILMDASTASGERELLQKQLLIIESITKDKLFTRASHMTNIFRTYWKLRMEIITSSPYKIDLPAMNIIKDELLKIMLLASEDKFNPKDVKAFYQTFNKFLIDLDKVQFDWFIETIPGVDMSALTKLKIIVPVDRETFRVVQPYKFAHTFPILFEKVHTPKHYVIETVIAFLACIQDQLIRTRWHLVDLLSPEEQLKTTGELIEIIQKILPHLGKQTSSESMFNAVIAPISDAVQHSNHLTDFHYRMMFYRQDVDKFSSKRKRYWFR